MNLKECWDSDRNIKFRNSKEAFDEAIQHGYLTKIDYDDGKYADDFMYMHTDITELNIETDYFKNIHTRKYLKINYS